ncbi:hypothetical protein pb186bvf_018035 [Paramecium bursaria]
MDLRNKLQRQKLAKDLEKALNNIMKEQSPVKLNLQEQFMRFSKYQEQKIIKQPTQQRLHSKSDHVRFLERAQSQLDVRNEKVQQSQERLIQQRMQQELQEATFHPQISKYSQQKFKNNKIKTGEEFYQSGLQWMKDKAQNIEQMKQSQCQKQQEIVFKPIVNKISEKIVQSKQNDFYQRQSNHLVKKKSNLEKIKRDITPTFKPKINKQSQNLQSNLNKELMSVTVDMGLLEQIRNYRDRLKENKQECYTPPPQMKCQTPPLQRQVKTQVVEDDDIPSFGQQKTIKKEPKLQIQLHSPKENMTEMMYEYLQDQNEFYNTSFYE